MHAMNLEYLTRGTVLSCINYIDKNICSSVCQDSIRVLPREVVAHFSQVLLEEENCVSNRS